MKPLKLIEYYTSKILVTLFVCCVFINNTNAQNNNIKMGKLANYLKKCEKRLDKITSNLDARVEKTIENYKEITNEYYSAATTNKGIKDEDGNTLINIRNDLKLADTLGTYKLLATTGDPYLDSLYLALDVYKSDSSFVTSADESLKERIELIQNKLNKLGGKFGASNKLKTFISDKREAFQKLVDDKLGIIPLGKINEQLYYYKQYVQNYKSILKDKAKWQQLLISQIIKLPAAQQLLRSNQILSSFFQQTGSNANLSGNMLQNLFANRGSSAAVTSSLQSRAAVQQLIVQSTGNTNTAVNVGQSVQTAIGKNMEAYQKAIAEAEKLNLKKIKEELKGFKKNDQKTKPFKKRLEFATDISFDKANRYLPNASNMAIKLGYKLNQNSSLGIGMVYKMGLGNGIRDIRLSNNGIGIRSFADIKWKRNIFITGGLEANYLRPFGNIRTLLNKNTIWQQSALLGMLKKVPIKGKKSMTMQVSFDFLYKKQIPFNQPVIFRTGYTF